MSLYFVQKILYQINRDSHTRKRFDTNFDELLEEYELSNEEIEALRKPDIGLLYIMGVNGQILMHYAAHCAYEWNEYLETMRNGLAKHGPVRAGLYATVWE